MKLTSLSGHVDVVEVHEFSSGVPIGHLQPVVMVLVTADDVVGPEWVFADRLRIVPTVTDHSRTGCCRGGSAQANPLSQEPAQPATSHRVEVAGTNLQEDR